MERYVSTTYRLQKLYVCIQGGYVSSTYPKYKIDVLNVYIEFFSREYFFVVDKLGMSFRSGSNCPQAS